MKLSYYEKNNETYFMNLIYFKKVDDTNISQKFTTILKIKYDMLEIFMFSLHFDIKFYVHSILSLLLSINTFHLLKKKKKHKKRNKEMKRTRNVFIFFYFNYTQLFLK